MPFLDRDIVIRSNRHARLKIRCFANLFACFELLLEKIEQNEHAARDLASCAKRKELESSGQGLTLRFGLLAQQVPKKQDLIR